MRRVLARVVRRWLAMPRLRVVRAVVVIIVVVVLVKCVCVCAQPVARTLLMMHPVMHYDYVALDAACGASLRCSLWRIPADAALAQVLELWMQPVAHPYRYSLGTMDTACGASILMLR